MNTFRHIALPAAAIFTTAVMLISTQAEGVQSGATPAQNSQTMPAPNSPGMLKAEEALALMNAMGGVWDMKGESFGPAGQSEFALTGRCVWQWAMGGAFLMCDTMMSNGSAILQEIDCLGFNAAAGTFQRTLMTDRDSATIWQQGSWDSNSKRFLMQSVGNIPTASGKARQVSTILDLSKPNTMDWTTSYYENGKIVGTYRIICTPAKPNEQESSVLPGMPSKAPTTASGSLDCNALQGQLNQMVANKQKMQGQIEDWKNKVKASQASFNQLSKPAP